MGNVDRSGDELLQATIRELDEMNAQINTVPDEELEVFTDRWRELSEQLCTELAKRIPPRPPTSATL